MEDALHTIESQNQLNNLETNLSSIKDGANISQQVKNASDIKNTIGELEQAKKEIIDATPSINSPLGTLKIGLTQIVIFYPVVLSIGFVIVCLELAEIMRYNKWVKDEGKNKHLNEHLHDELKN